MTNDERLAPMTRPLPGDLSARELAPADLDAAVGLIETCDRTYLDWAPPAWRPPELHWYRDRWAERLEADEHWSLGAFEPEARLVGLVAIRPDYDREGNLVPGVGHVSSLFVHPDRWREGIASWLLAQGEAEMSNRGFPVGRLWTPDGAPAQAFYRAAGYEMPGVLFERYLRPETEAPAR